MWSVTAKELRGQLLVLTVVMWAGAAIFTLTPGMQYRSGLIKGADFVQFYVQGSLVAQGRADLLYDVEVERAEQERLVPESRATWFFPVYGPQVALLMGPIVKLPYAWAALVWTSLTALLYAACVWVLWRDCPSLRQHQHLVALAAIGFPPFCSLIVHGQTSALPLVCVTGAWLALKADKRWWAGVALGSLVVKPQLGAAVAAVIIMRREWRMLGGALTAVAVQWGVAAIALGVGPLLDYFQMLRRGPELAALLEPKLYQLHSLRAFWSLLVPQPTVALGLYLVSGAALLALTVRLWRPSVHLQVRYSALVLTTVLVSPHLGIYELVVLVPAFLMTADACEGSVIRPRRTFRVLLYAAYALPLLGPLAAVTHVQLSVPVLTAWLVALGRRSAARVQG
jgi:hypothetical protein